MNGAAACFELCGVSFSYPGRDAPALRGLTFSVPRGQFVTLCGPSGSGKTTLLRLLKPALAPHGSLTGSILFGGRPLGEADPRTQCARIGFVRQSAENQIVTDKVWHELAFGLESLGYPTPEIRARVAEMAEFFGIRDWFDRDVSQLSGGQKQLLSLASVMAMQPDALILDEPTGQLDPIAASDFLSAVGRVSRELGTTVLLAEHRLEEAFPMSDRAMVLDGGALIADGAPREVGEQLRRAGHPMFLSMPAAMRIWAAAGTDAPCPVTVRDGRAWLAAFAAEHPLLPLPSAPASRPGEELLRLDGVWFGYGKGQPDVLRGLTLSARRGELLAVLGGNGAGKTTALALAAGLQKPRYGEVRAGGRVAVLPQDPQTLFVKKTVRADLYEILDGRCADAAEADARVGRAVRLCRLEALLDRHPYDLSGGEQQRAALAKVLLCEPDILLLDEPTKGLDAEFKHSLAGLLKTLCRRGAAVLMVSHDVEFCAETADRCALFFGGAVVSQGTPREFFSGNCFYTTAASRMARPLLPGAVTAGDVIAACGGTPPPPPAEEPGTSAPIPAPAAEEPKSPLPLWRKLTAALSGLCALAVLIRAVGGSDLSALTSPTGAVQALRESAVLYAVLFASLLALALSVSRRAPRVRRPPQPARRRLPRRTVLAAAVSLLLIPATVLAGTFFFGGRKYYFISLLVLLEAMLPFALVFEGRKPRARELVLVAALSALGVAGRAAFFMLPEFKPVWALTILAGAAFGGETGFLTGAMTMLASNVLFGQGPWTPWQMFAMGLTGLLAGVLFRPGALRPGRAALCVYGALACVVVYGGILNPAAALMWVRTPDWRVFLTYYATGLPVDLVHAGATVVFLWFLSEPMLEKFRRVRTKYGLLE